MTAAGPQSAPDPAWPDDAVEVGRIAGAWGVKGWVRVQPFAADAQALFASRRWFLKPPEDGPLRRPGPVDGGFPALVRVAVAKTHGDAIVAQLQGVDGREGAEALRGGRIFVGRSSFPTAGPDEYYWIDLLGLAVVNRQDEALGQVVGLIDTGPHSVLRVAPEGRAGDAAAAEERLIPFVAAYVDEVSLEARRIVVDWGLDY